MIRSIVLFSFLLLLGMGSALAQREDIVYKDSTYLPGLRSVRLYQDVDQMVNQNSLIGGEARRYPVVPILELGGDSQLYLSFDDLNERQRTFFYTVIHCNADWTPSDLDPLEYINGFDEDEIENFDYSFNTMTSFTHFWLNLPNDDMEFTQSGNYLLVVFDDTDDRQIAFTRRFILSEDLVAIDVEEVRPARVAKQDTHQEFDVTVTSITGRLRTPTQSVRLSVYQNWRPDNAVIDLAPQGMRQDDVLFDFQDRIVFEGGKEFRNIDLRNLIFPRRGVFEASRETGVWEVAAVPSKKRGRSAYLTSLDINGNYTVENLDRDDNDLQSDYANVLFSLESPTQYYDEEVYLFGAMSDWDLRPEFKMTYSDQYKAYLVNVKLKQGFYDFAYVTVPERGGAIDWSLTEGNSYQTENLYSFVVYYRPPGARFDRVLGYRNYKVILQ